MKIVLAEDEAKIRQLLTEYLTEEGHQVIPVSGGYDAIRAVKEHRPDAILLDGLLPELHGFEVARYLREQLDYRLFIVLITAIYKANRYRSEALLKYGVDRYLVKPVTKEAVLQALADVTSTPELASN